MWRRGIDSSGYTIRDQNFRSVEKFIQIKKKKSKTDIAAQSDSYPLGNMAFSQWVERSRRQADFSPPSIAKVKKWKETFISPTCPSGVCRNYCTFYIVCACVTG